MEPASVLEQHVPLSSDFWAVKVRREGHQAVIFQLPHGCGWVDPQALFSQNHIGDCRPLRRQDLWRVLDQQAKQFDNVGIVHIDACAQHRNLKGRFRTLYVCVRPTHLAPDLNGWCARQRMVYAAIDSR